jgi:hypothetical protein
MFDTGTATDQTRIGSAHLVQLFDSDESLADAVADFLGQGLRNNGTVLAVMDEQRWYAVAMRMSASGWPIDEAIRAGDLTVRNAAETLRTFMRRDKPDAGLFQGTVEHLVSSLAARGKPLWIYGEMVDVLASQGEYAAAHELEGLWNTLGTRVEFTLFCGYSAAHFGDPRNAGALRRICASHSQVLSDPRDVLGSFLLRSHTPDSQRSG